MTGDITVNLPISLVESGLSAEEIGAIFILFSLRNVKDSVRSSLEGREDIVKAGKSLVERGIVEFRNAEGQEREMVIDLEKIKPMKFQKEKLYTKAEIIEQLDRILQ